MILIKTIRMLICFNYMIICLHFATAQLLQKETLKNITECDINADITLTCAGDEMIAVRSLQYAYNVSCEGTCCSTYASTDCFVNASDTNIQDIRRVCSGRSSCNAPTPPDKLEFSTCSLGVKDISYIFVQYYCIPKERISSICSNGQTLTSDDAPLYLTNENYPSITSGNASCSCSLEIYTCSSSINMYILDADLYLDTTACYQTLEFLDGSYKTLHTVGCESHYSNQVESLTANSHYLKIDFINNSTSNQEGYFFIGLEDEQSNVLDIPSESGASFSLSCNYEQETWCVGCGDDPVIANGNIELSNVNDSSYEAAANVICDSGFETNTTTIYCLSNGTWPTPVCTEKAACTASQWRCTNGDCVLDNQRCDNFSDCMDLSDEDNCGDNIKISYGGSKDDDKPKSDLLLINVIAILCTLLLTQLGTMCFFQCKIHSIRRKESGRDSEISIRIGMTILGSIPVLGLIPIYITWKVFYRDVYKATHRKHIKEAKGVSVAFTKKTYSDVSCINATISDEVHENEIRLDYAETETKYNRLFERQSGDNNDGDRNRKKQKLFASNEKKIEYNSTDFQSDLSNDNKVNKTEDVSNEGKEGKLMAVISPIQGPGVNSKSSICEGLQLTRERVQFSGDSENTPKENTENTNNKGQTKNGAPLSIAENQNIDVKELAKYEENGTHSQKINWIQVFLQLARSFPPTQWEMFALHLLSNCPRVRHINVHDTIEEIKLEARNEHTTGWICHAYIKVFKKWLEIVGDTAENLEQIKQAVYECIESKEVKDSVLLIIRDPPKLPCVAREIEQTPKHPVSYVQPCYALHDIETPSASCSIHYSSRQVQSIQSSRYGTCSRFLPCSATLQSLPNGQAMQASFQYTEMNFEPNCNDESQTLHKEQGKGKKRKTSQFQDKMKLSKLESYARDNAKQNLLSNLIPIRQCDYDIYMEHVVDLVMKECNVNRKIVLSITYKTFCEVEEVTTKRNEKLYIVYCGSPKLILKKEVYNDFDIYGNIVRPKLLAYLDAQKIEYDTSDANTFLFLSFNGNAAFGQLDVHRKREKIAEKPTITQLHSLQELVSTASSKETNGFDKNENKEITEIQYTRKHKKQATCTSSDWPQSIEQPADGPVHSNQSAEAATHINEKHVNDFQRKEHGTTNKDYTHSLTRIKGVTSEVTGQTKEFVSKNVEIGNEMKILKSTDMNKKCETVLDDRDPLALKIEVDDELKEICDSFFQTGEESFTIDKPDTIPDILSSFVDQDSVEQ